MFTRKLEVSAMLIAALCFLFTSKAVAGPDIQEMGKHHGVTWESSKGETASGIWLYTHSDRGMISRVLILDPANEPIVLTRIIDAAGGTQRSRLSIDTSGWWIEYAEDFGTSWPNIHKALRYIIEGGDSKGSGQSPLVRQTLRTSAGFELSSTATLRRGRLLPNLMEEIESEGLRAELGVSIPPAALKSAALVLEAVEAERDPSRKIGGDVTTVLELCLWAAASPGAEVPRAGWRLEKLGDLDMSLTLHEPTLLEIVAKFPSLDNVDPMKGLRPSDLFPR